MQIKTAFASEQIFNEMVTDKISWDRQINNCCHYAGLLTTNNEDMPYSKNKELYGIRALFKY